MEINLKEKKLRVLNENGIVILIEELILAKLAYTAKV